MAWYEKHLTNSIVDKLRQITWPKALLGMAITCIVSLSVHVVMLQVLNVPYPADYPTTGWPVFANLALTALALIYFYRLTTDDFARFSLPVRWLLVFILTAMLREALFRLPIMNAIATTAWIYSLVDSLPRLLILFLMSGLVVLAAPWLRQLWQMSLGAMLMASVLYFGAQPLIDKAFGYLLTSIAYLNHEEVYKVPYGWQIELPAYITYMEPVIACFVMVLLVWDRLEGSSFIKICQFTLLVLLINRTFIRPFVYVFYSKFTPMIALLSMGQFFLEALSLALLTVLTWRLCQKPDLTVSVGIKDRVG